MWKKCEWERNKWTKSVIGVKHKWLWGVPDEMQVLAECIVSARGGRAAGLRVIFTVILINMVINSHTRSYVGLAYIVSGCIVYCMQNSLSITIYPHTRLLMKWLPSCESPPSTAFKAMADKLHALTKTARMSRFASNLRESHTPFHSCPQQMGLVLRDVSFRAQYYICLLKFDILSVYLVQCTLLKRTPHTTQDWQKIQIFIDLVPDIHVN